MPLTCLVISSIGTEEFEDLTATPPTLAVFSSGVKPSTVWSI